MRRAVVYASFLALAAPPMSLGAQGVFPQSAHPYANNTFQSWTYTGPSTALAVDVVFDARTALESGYDTLSIRDSSGRHVTGSPFSGPTLAGRTVRVPGSRFTLEFRTDGSIAFWGFAITDTRPILPPTPAVPMNLKPASGRVIGPLVFAWDSVPGASGYDLELSLNSGSWTRVRVGGNTYSPDLSAGNWLWRVRSIVGGQEGSFTSNMAVQVAAGYVLSIPAAPAAAGREMRILSRAYRNPGPMTLSVSGLPAGVSARLEPATVSGNAEIRLTFNGLENLSIPGDYPYTILSAGAPIEGAVTGSLVIAGGFEIADLHAYPNPARGGWTRIKISIGRAAQTLRVRIFDVSGALVREVEEASPFQSFRNPAFGVYEFEWNGSNDAGRAVASEKYIYTVRAQSAAGEAQGRGLLTFICP